MSQFSLIKYEKEMHNLNGEERLFWKGHDETKEGEPAGCSLGNTTWLACQRHRGQSGRVGVMAINQGPCLWPETPNGVKGNVSAKIKDKTSTEAHGEAILEWGLGGDRKEWRGSVMGAGREEKRGSGELKSWQPHSVRIPAAAGITACHGPECSLECGKKDLN